MDKRTDPPAATDGTPAPSLTGTDIALLLITALLPLGPLPAGTYHLWRRSTTAGELQEALAWLRDTPAVIEDAIKFRERNGDFDISQEALSCLDTFNQDYGM